MVTQSKVYIHITQTNHSVTHLPWFLLPTLQAVEHFSRVFHICRCVSVCEKQQTIIHILFSIYHPLFSNIQQQKILIYLDLVLWNVNWLSKVELQIHQTSIDVFHLGYKVKFNDRQKSTLVIVVCQLLVLGISYAKYYIFLFWHTLPLKLSIKKQNKKPQQRSITNNDYNNTTKTGVSRKVYFTIIKIRVIHSTSKPSLWLYHQHNH